MVTGRLLFGTALFAAPRTAMGAIGLEPDEHRQALHWGRVFGIRDAALGLGLLASRGDARRLWWRLGLLCDLGDATAGLASWRAGDLPHRPRTLVLFTGTALVGVGLGAAALRAGDV